MLESLDKMWIIAEACYFLKPQKAIRRTQPSYAKN